MTFNVYLTKAHDRIFAYVLGPECTPDQVEHLGDDSKAKEFTKVTSAIGFARDSRAAVIAVKGVPGWPDFDMTDMDRLISG